MPNTLGLKQLFPLFILAVMFVATSYVAHRYENVISAFVTQGNTANVAFFILLTAAFVIFVIPLDIAFLIPVGAHV